MIYYITMYYKPSKDYFLEKRDAILVLLFLPKFYSSIKYKKKLIAKIYKLLQEAKTSAGEDASGNALTEFVDERQMVELMSAGPAPRMATKWGNKLLKVGLALVAVGSAAYTYKSTMGNVTLDYSDNVRVMSLMLDDIKLAKNNQQILESFLDQDGEFNMTKALIDNGVNPKNVTFYSNQYKSGQYVGMLEDLESQYKDKIDEIQNEIEPDGWFASFNKPSGIALKRLEDKQTAYENQITNLKDFNATIYEALDATNKIFNYKSLASKNLGPLSRNQIKLIEQYDAEIVEACFELKKCETQQEFLDTLSEIIRNTQIYISRSARVKEQESIKAGGVFRLKLLQTVANVFSYLPYVGNWVYDLIAQEHATLFEWAVISNEYFHTYADYFFYLLGTGLAVKLPFKIYAFLKIQLEGSFLFPDKETLGLYLTNDNYYESANKANIAIEDECGAPALSDSNLRTSLYFGTLMFDRMVQVAGPSRSLYVKDSITGATMTERGKTFFNKCVKLVQAMVAGIEQRFKANVDRLDQLLIDGSIDDNKHNIGYDQIVDSFEKRIKNIPYEFGAQGPIWGNGLTLLKLETILHMSTSFDLVKSQKSRKSLSKLDYQYLLVRGVDKFWENELTKTLIKRPEVGTQIRRKKRNDDDAFPYTFEREEKTEEGKPPRVTKFLGGYFIKKKGQEYPLITDETNNFYTKILSVERNTNKFPSYFIARDEDGERCVYDNTAVFYYDKFKEFVKMWSEYTRHPVESQNSSSTIELLLGSVGQKLQLQN